MAQATEEQHRRFAIRLLSDGRRQDWDKGRMQELLDLPPAQFNLLLSVLVNGRREMAARLGPPEPLAIRPPSPIRLQKSFDPAKFIGPGWTIWRGSADGDGTQGEEDQDARSLALTEFDFSTLVASDFMTGLIEDSEEKRIEIGEKRNRLEAKAISPDARFADSLLREDGQRTLRYISIRFGITEFQCLGTVLRRSDGIRYFLYLYSASGQWDYGYRRESHFSFAHSVALTFPIQS